MTDSDAFLRLPDVKRTTGLARSTIYLLISEGRFPRPVALSSRAVGWVASEVDAWKRAQIAARGEPVSAAFEGQPVTHECA